MAVERKYTPGPWRLKEEDGDGKCQHKDRCKTWVIDSFERGNMALIQAWQHGNDPDVFDEVRVNARLMAAAPELIEALDKLLAATVDEDLKYGIGLTETEEEARSLALSVIAKVVGE